MIYTRLFGYNSENEADGYRDRTKNYTKYILLGDTNEDKLNEVLKTVDITLKGLPFREEFAPTTNFIYEQWDAEPDLESSYSRVWHMVVQEDTVSQPILSDNNYFDHHLTLIEASAVAQTRVVDNISATYKLQDVTLDGKTIIKTDLNVEPNLTVANYSSRHGIFQKKLGNMNMSADVKIGKRLFWNFPTWFGEGSPYYGTENDWKQFKYYQAIPAGSTKHIKLPIPMLEIKNGKENDRTYEHMGYCDVETVVVKSNLNGTNKTVIFDEITHPANDVSEEATWVNDWAGNASKGEIVSKSEIGLELVPPVPFRFKFSDTIERVATHAEHVADTVRFIEFDAEPNCVYQINVMLPRNFTLFYKQSAISYGVAWSSGNPEVVETNNMYPVASMSFVTYVEGEDKKIYFKKAPDMTAYALFQKAQIATQDVIKQRGTPITETPQSFYIEDEDKLELENTKIVENFYNQKNFWEILLEIGKYIHAIPEVRFGTNGRYVVKWRKLGRTDKKIDNATKMTIFNSRSLENYISSCSSYVTNAVQLGGIIDEWVAPKSSSEDYLVYNDVAQVITSMPIIEIVDMEVKCIKTNSQISGIHIGDTASLVQAPAGSNLYNGFIFEENVYNLLSVSAADQANKGLAIYYSLGTNIIKGFDYRLPTVNVGDADNEYAIKRIIGTVFGQPKNLWAYIKVNDFVFHVVYRTKDNIRSDQSRPDLRKYLLNSPHDQVPQHYQFNNQQDIVVDSTKFGNNVYGKLIRTGNTSYTVTEKCNDLRSVKEVGDLYTINGEWYYVATVKSVNYKTHMICEVTFSKDYNQLSEIIGIPSEPRFYEISEQSLINRQKSLNDYLVLGTEFVDLPYNPQSHYVRRNGWDYVRGLLFNQTSNFPKYALTVFKNDVDKRVPEAVGNETFYKEVCHPVNTYSIQNTLTMKWSMVDNFSAGDKVEPTNASVDSSTTQRTVDSAYNKLQPVRYTDIYGRSDLVDFAIMNSLDGLSTEQIQSLPESPVRTRFHAITSYAGKITFTEGIPSYQWLYDTMASFVGTLTNGCGVQIAFNTITEQNTYLYYYDTSTSSWKIYQNAPLDDYEVQLIEDSVTYQSGVIINDPNFINKPVSYKVDTNNGDIDWSAKPIDAYANQYLFGNELYEYLGDNERGIGLMKDNREQISLNFNLQMITDSDRFVLSSWLWQPNKGSLRLALLDEEINKISNDTVPHRAVIAEFPIDTTDTNPATAGISTVKDDTTGHITILLSRILGDVSDETMQNTKAIAIISENIVADNVTSGQRYFVMGRNVSDLTIEDKKRAWYIYNYDKRMFAEQ